MQSCYVPTTDINNKSTKFIRGENMSTETKDLSLLKHKSGIVSLGPDRAPARSMLRAVGLGDDDMEKPFVAVANLASDVTPCNVHLTRIAERAKEGYGTHRLSLSCSVLSPSVTAYPWELRG